MSARAWSRPVFRAVAPGETSEAGAALGAAHVVPVFLAAADEAGQLRGVELVEGADGGHRAAALMLEGEFLAAGQISSESATNHPSF
jgi:hypothetical protein